MTATIQAQKVDEIPEWQMMFDYVETCNCDFGCPCNLSGFPTYGFCRAMVFYHIKDGDYGDTSLDGLDAVYVASWPKAIHEGDGTLQVYVTSKANEKQRKAITQIFYGWAKGNGCFALFGTTMKYNLEPQFVEIVSNVDGKKSSFSVPGVLEVETEPFKNPVTGEEADARITLPKGFIWQEAQACYTKKMRIVSPNISFDDSGKNAFFVSNLKFKGP